jgi:Flp pilus assembly protein TadG
MTVSKVAGAAPDAHSEVEAVKLRRVSAPRNQPVENTSRIPQVARRRFQEFAGCRRGVAAVEFALIALPLLSIMFGMIAACAVFFASASMQGSAQYGARVMATGVVKNNNIGAITLTNTTAGPIQCSSSFTAAQVESYACSNLPKWATFRVTTAESCSTVPTTISTVTVTLTTSLSSAAVMDVFNFFASKTLTSTAVVMKEGQCP